MRLPGLFFWEVRAAPNEPEIFFGLWDEPNQATDNKMIGEGESIWPAAAFEPIILAGFTKTLSHRARM